MHMNEPIHFDTLRGRLLRDESMARHVSWRAGGRAKQAYVRAVLQDLAAYLHTLAADEAVCLLGLGSNLLVRDGGFEGMVVLMNNSHGLMGMDGVHIYDEARVASPKVARFAALHG